MIRAFKSIAAGGSIAALLAVPAAAADLTVLAKVTGDKPGTTTSYITSDKIRMAQPGGQEMIIDAKGEFTFIDNTKKEYSVMTKQEFVDAATAMQARVQEAQEKMKANQAKMDEAMKNMPPAMREKMQAMQSRGIGGAMAQMIDVKKGAGHRTIAGYGCDNWIITVGEMSKTEECLSTEVAFPVEAWDTYRDMAQAFKGGAMAQGMEDMREKMKQLKGFPLARTTTTNILGKTFSETVEVTEITKGAVPANAFQIPAGYKRVEAPLTKAAQSMKK